MTSLNQIYKHHDAKLSDKWESYLVNYEEILEKYKEKRVNLLEIGIQNGGSLEIWAKYFNYFNKLVGCDINPNCNQLSYLDPRISVVIGDVNAEQVEKDILNHAEIYQIIIDDGSHTSKDIVTTFANYFKYVDEGGVYIIEDLHCSYWAEFGGGVYDPYSSISFIKCLIDVINNEHFIDNLSIHNLLSGFEQNFEVNFDIEELRKISSIKIYNSLCVISKSDNGRASEIGKRVVCGNDEIITCGSKLLNGSSIAAPPQNDNFWNNLVVPPNEAYIEHIKKINQLEESIKELRNNISNIEKSLSWKITKPLRIFNKE